MNDGYHDLGNPRRQKELLEQALSIFKKYYGPYNFQVAIALANLGIAYGDLGNHRRQKELLKQALPILEKHYGPDHPEVAKLLAELDDI